MNISTSQCDSGCESGWTLYLDQSSYSKSQCHSFGTGIVNKEEEDDLSMVSDASSGPRHYCEDDEDCSEQNGYYSSVPEASKKMNKKKKNLEDTASSHVRCFSKKNVLKNGNSTEHAVNFSQGFSATHYKQEKSTLSKHYSFLPSTFAGKPATGKHGGF